MAYDSGAASLLRLAMCDRAVPAQAFDFKETSGEIVLRSDADQCLTVGEESRSAGPFVSRPLSLAPYAEAAGALKTWVVLP
ncbi:MAG: RICIN domain-containing protein [Rhodobacteraceae bacterium]|nr:RICIN domain-containing protein [Paracoccaceae bacterium]